MNEWQQLDLRFGKDSDTMDETVDVDQFQLLEKKVDSLIVLITDLRKEKELLTDQIQAQKIKVVELTKQIGSLNTNKERVKQRIVSLLERINHIDA